MTTPVISAWRNDPDGVARVLVRDAEQFSGALPAQLQPAGERITDLPGMIYLRQRLDAGYQ